MTTVSDYGTPPLVKQAMRRAGIDARWIDDESALGRYLAIMYEARDNEWWACGDLTGHGVVGDRQCISVEVRPSMLRPEGTSPNRRMMGGWDATARASWAVGGGPHLPAPDSPPSRGAPQGCRDEPLGLDSRPDSRSRGAPGHSIGGVAEPPVPRPL